MELILTLALEVTDQIKVFSVIRLLDLILFLLFLFSIIKNKGRFKTSFISIWALIILRLTYVYLSLLFKENFVLSQFLSNGYFFEFVLVFYLSENLNLNFNKLWHYGEIIIVINTIFALVEIIINKGIVRSYGFMGAGFSNFYLPFMLSWLFIDKSIFKKLFFLISLVVIILSFQRTLLVILGISIFLYLFMDLLKSKNFMKFIKYFMIIVISSVFIWLLIPTDLKNMVLSRFLTVFNRSTDINDSMNIRYALWGVAISLFLKNALFGIGTGAFSRLTLNDFVENYRSPFPISAVGLSTHNNFLEYLVELGIIGFFLTYLIIINLFIKISRIAKKNLINTTPMYKILLTSCITLTIYDFFGQSTFFPFWCYNILLMIVYVKKDWSKYGS